MWGSFKLVKLLSTKSKTSRGMTDYMRDQTIEIAPTASSSWLINVFWSRAFVKLLAHPRTWRGPMLSHSWTIFTGWIRNAYKDFLHCWTSWEWWIRYAKKASGFLYIWIRVWVHTLWGSFTHTVNILAPNPVADSNKGGKSSVRFSGVSFHISNMVSCDCRKIFPKMLQHQLTG